MENNKSAVKFIAVVESGSCSCDYQTWEEKRHCGHAHKTYRAAMECGNRHYNAHTDKTGGWSANADWHGFTIHDQDGHRVDEYGNR